MKIYVVALLVFLSISSTIAQDLAKITITSNKKIPKGYILNVQNENYGFDPDKRRHELELSVTEPDYGFLISPKGKLYTFWYEKGEVQVFFEQSLFKKELTVSGSESHIIFDRLRNASDFEDFREVFDSNKHTVVALRYIDRYFKSHDFSEDECREIHKMIAEEKLDKTPNFEAYINTLDKDKLAKDGQFLDFKGFDQHENTFNTADYRGQYLLVDVAATWCGPCWKAFPYMIESFRANQNIQFITLNEDSQVERWNAMAKKRGLEIDWPVIWEVDADKKELLLQYQIEAFPTYILVNPEGVVIDRWSYSNQSVFNSKLKKHLK